MVVGLDYLAISPHCLFLDISAVGFSFHFPTVGFNYRPFPARFRSVTRSAFFNSITTNSTSKTPCKRFLFL